MHRMSFLDATIHVNFAINALLNSLVCLNPRPPCYLIWQSLSHDLQAKYLLDSFFRFHQNLCVMASNPSLVLVGTSKVEKVYVASAWAVNFIIVLRPAQEKHLLLQPISLTSNFSWRNLKS